VLSDLSSGFHERGNMTRISGTVVATELCQGRVVKHSKIIFIIFLSTQHYFQQAEFDV
jgi:hypothetical protein